MSGQREAADPEKDAQNMGAEVTRYGCCHGGTCVLGCLDCARFDPGTSLRAALQETR